MIDYKFRPNPFFTGDITSVLLARLHYPESTWGEQISLYAHLIDGKIQFEAVDFYGNDYILYPSSSWEPLQMEDMIYLIEGMQLNQDTHEGAMDLVLDGIPEVESHFYPQLKKYFEEKRKSFGLD
ncbi:UDP-glucuronosyltransferase [Algoriphagus sp. AK58]|uniref:UDP-glucuronosyltransferase n=1 Tax=Algoriphagus sp. AK58 TaxID=1406877 RepID=UPI00164F103C|nr:UDP-glucuronosyltransferase [Algoriphagus sp. AK58]MBC6365497.1 UDP-glucuronosyltransferase [Algoriphagus sp. AK58]